MLVVPVAALFAGCSTAELDKAKADLKDAQDTIKELQADLKTAEDTINELNELCAPDYSKAEEVKTIGWNESVGLWEEITHPSQVPQTTEYATAYDNGALIITVKAGKATQFCFLAEDAFSDITGIEADNAITLDVKKGASTPDGFTKVSTQGVSEPMGLDFFDEEGDVMVVYVPADIAVLADEHGETLAEANGLDYTTAGLYILTYTFGGESFVVVLNIVA